MDEGDTIAAFVRFVRRRCGNPALVVDRWPDKENRREPEIDAIAGHLAIEHTSIDTLEDQRRRDDWYLSVVDGLGGLIEEAVPCGAFTITLRFDAIGEGMNRKTRKAIRDDLERWLTSEAPLLENGRYEVLLPTSESNAPPIVMTVWKAPAPRCTGFQRSVPDADTLSARLRDLLEKKATKLRKYQEDFTTVLLVENDDIALMYELKMREALQMAYPDGPPQGVDEIWFAHTAVPTAPRFRELTPGRVDE